MAIIQEKLVADMKTAMKAKNKIALTTIRMAISAINQKEIDQRSKVSDEDALAIIIRMIKQRNESALQYKNANREELAEKELEEINFLKVYLPEELSEDEVITIIKNAILETNSDSIKDLGKIMSHIKSKLTGRADMTKVSTMIKSELI